MQRLLCKYVSARPKFVCRKTGSLHLEFSNGLTLTATPDIYEGWHFGGSNLYLHSDYGRLNQRIFMKPKVFVGRRIPQPGLDKLQEHCDVMVWPHERPASPAELRAWVRNVEGFLSVAPDRVDEALLDAAPRLKVVSNHAVGVDNIDVEACRRRGVAVGNTPDVLTDSTADVAWTLLLATAWRVVEADYHVRSGAWKGWSPTQYWGSDVSGMTLGIVGLGRIGQAVARRARGFGMTILYHSREAKPEAERELGVRRAGLEDLLRDSDFVSLNCALTDETRGLINEDRLAMMKPDAILVNTARGAVVDQAALTRSLQNGVIRGAGLDVFEAEPVPIDDPILQLPNVVLMPHLGSATERVRGKMSLLAANNLLAGLRGEPLPHPV
jgi:glyoxylate reductase